MDPFTNRPTRGDQPDHQQLLRAKPGRSTGGVITSHDILGAYTHYWHGRTRPCENQPCEACDEGRTPRWYGYVGIWAPATRGRAILELTISCIDPIDHWFKEHGTLRAAQVSVHRLTNKINSRLIAEISASNYGTDALPPAPDLRAILCRMWEITEQTQLRTRGEYAAKAGTLRVAENGNGR